MKAAQQVLSQGILFLIKYQGINEIRLHTPEIYGSHLNTNDLFSQILFFYFGSVDQMNKKVLELQKWKREF